MNTVRFTDVCNPRSKAFIIGEIADWLDRFSDVLWLPAYITVPREYLLEGVR